MPFASNDCSAGKVRNAFTKALFAGVRGMTGLESVKQREGEREGDREREREREIGRERDSARKRKTSVGWKST